MSDHAHRESLRVPAALLAALLILFTAACHESVTGPKEGRLRVGSWGGTAAGLEVAETGATAAFACARGRIDQPIVLDRENRFDVSGTYIVEVGPASLPYPARYSGQIDGDRMILTVKRLDLDQTVGTYTLTFGVSFRGIFCV